MIKVAVCDDQESVLNEYEKIIEKIAISNDYNVEIFKFISGEELIKAFSTKGLKFDIIFLDIIMDGINGIEVAKKIRDFDRMVEIVFITNSKAFALDGYEVRAYNYIIKNSEMFYSKIFEALKHSYSDINDYFIINNKSIVQKIRLKDIVFFESNKRKVIIHTNYKQYEVYDKLDNIYKTMIDKYFYKCHRSYVINISYIKKIDLKDIITVYDNVIPISRGKKDKLKLKFIEYIECKR